MKKLILFLLYIFMFFNIYSQSESKISKRQIAQHRRDTIKRLDVRLPIFFEINMIGNYYFKRKTPIDGFQINSYYGSGPSISFGYRVRKKTELKFGGSAFIIPIDEDFKQEFAKRNIQPNTTITELDDNHNESSINSTNLFLSVTKIYRKSNYYIEPYLKFSFAQFYYRIENLIYKKFDTTNYSEYITINSFKRNYSYCPSLGTTIRYKSKKIISFMYSLEAGYCFGKHYLTENTLNSSSKTSTRKIMLNSPSFLLQHSFGINIRISHKFLSDEKKFYAEKTKQLIDKYNY